MLSVPTVFRLDLIWVTGPVVLKSIQTVKDMEAGL